jgi:hypothetical protein
MSTGPVILSAGQWADWASFFRDGWLQHVGGQMQNLLPCAAYDATNFTSRDSLKVLTRWGFRLWLRQMLLMVDLLIPWRWAINRQLQWVCPLAARGESM